MAFTNGDSGPVLPLDQLAEALRALKAPPPGLEVEVVPGAGRIEVIISADTNPPWFGMVLGGALLALTPCMVLVLVPLAHALTLTGLASVTLFPLAVFLVSSGLMARQGVLVLEVNERVVGFGRDQAHEIRRGAVLAVSITAHPLPTLRWRPHRRMPIVSWNSVLTIDPADGAAFRVTAFETHHAQWVAEMLRLLAGASDNAVSPEREST